MAIVVTNAGFAGGSGPVNITLTTAFAEGDVLWGAAALGASRLLTSVTDAGGNTYTLLNGGQTTFGGTQGLRAFYTVVGPGGLASGSTLTLNFSGNASYSGCAIQKLTGVSTSPLDLGGAGGTTATGSDTNPTITTAALAVADEVVLGATGIASGGSDTYTSPGFSTYQNNYNSNAQKIVLASQVQTGNAGGTVARSDTISNSRSWATLYVTFKPAGAASALGSGGALLGMVG